LKDWPLRFSPLKSRLSASYCFRTSVALIRCLVAFGCYIKVWVLHPFAARAIIALPNQSVTNDYKAIAPQSVRHYWKIYSHSSPDSGCCAGKNSKFSACSRE
jgi:hypothetical protein